MIAWFATAWAEAPTASGHVKAFELATFDDGSSPLPTPLRTRSLVDVRVNLGWRGSPRWELEVAHAVTANLDPEPVGGSGGGDFGTGVGLSAPEAVPLTWQAYESPDDLRLQGRTDRLWLRTRQGPVTATLGRQPVGFGASDFFTPLDLIGPFNPATLDAEYRPGVDAARVDVHAGNARLTAVVAWTGARHVFASAPPAESAGERLTGALQGQATAGTTDLGLFLGAIRGDLVGGASAVGGVGGLGLHAEATVTSPREDLDEAVFVRAVAGVHGSPGPTTSVTAEVYVQTLGDADPASMLAMLASERWTRGELWLTGVGYVGASVGQAFTPLVSARLAAVVSVTDPSVLLVPSVSWNAAQDVDVAAGAFVGLGDRASRDAGGVEPRSELGTWPASAYLRMRAWF